MKNLIFLVVSRGQWSPFFALGELPQVWKLSRTLRMSLLGQHLFDWPVRLLNGYWRDGTGDFRFFYPLSSYLQRFFRKCYVDIFVKRLRRSQAAMRRGKFLRCTISKRSKAIYGTKMKTLLVANVRKDEIGDLSTVVVFFLLISICNLKAWSNSSYGHAISVHLNF